MQGAKSNIWFEMRFVFLWGVMVYLIRDQPMKTFEIFVEVLLRLDE